MSVSNSKVYKKENPRRKDKRLKSEKQMFKKGDS